MSFQLAPLLAIAAGLAGLSSSVSVESLLIDFSMSLTRRSYFGISLL